jgi:hypothetical protein
MEFPPAKGYRRRFWLYQLTPQNDPAESRQSSCPGKLTYEINGQMMKLLENKESMEELAYLQPNPTIGEIEQARELQSSRPQLLSRKPQIDLTGT